jgi:transcriptional regulator with XRE-family HTH domain
VVGTSHRVHLRDGRVSSPGYEKLAAIARAMGLPPEAWFEDISGDGARVVPTEGRDIAGRVEHLFGSVRHPKTGEPYTSAEVARMTLGDLSEEEVEGIRTGRVRDPTVCQVAALAAVFGVPSSYLLDRNQESSVLDEEEVEALADETTREITREALRLPERERRIVLGILRQFGEAALGDATKRNGRGILAVSALESRLCSREDT